MPAYIHFPFLGTSAHFVTVGKAPFRGHVQLLYEREISMLFLLSTCLCAIRSATRFGQGCTFCLIFCAISSHLFPPCTGVTWAWWVFAPEIALRSRPVFFCCIVPGGTGGESTERGAIAWQTARRSALIISQVSFVRILCTEILCQVRTTHRFVHVRTSEHVRSGM